MTHLDADGAVLAVGLAVARADNAGAADAAATALVDELKIVRAVIWQTDYVMKSLHPVGGAASRTERQGVKIAGSLPGDVFRTQQAGSVKAGRYESLILPLSSRGHRIGVVQLTCRHGHAETIRSLAERCVELLAPLLWEVSRGNDVMERRRRTGRLSLPAEMQWQLLQARGLHVKDRFSVYAQLEPADLVSSDLFDWSYDGQKITVTLLDAAGEGVLAAQTSELALTALRNARRASLSLMDGIALTDQTLWDESRGRAEVAATVLEHDLRSGETVVVRAGTPAPIICRPTLDIADVRTDPPLGVADGTAFQPQYLKTRPGDLLLLMTDGVLGALNPQGEQFGLTGLTEVLEKKPSDMEIPRAIVHSVRAHVGTMLPDDATCIALRLAPLRPSIEGQPTTDTKIERLNHPSLR